MGRKAHSPKGYRFAYSPHLVPALSECITEADTMEELESNLKDIIEGWLEVASDFNSKGFLSSFI